MNLVNFADEHLPDVLTGFGIAGWIGASILAVHNTPKALASIEAKKKELNVEKLTIRQTVEATWKHYISPVVTAVAATTCLVSANSVNAGRNATLAAALSMSNTAYKNYREKVEEVAGKEVKEKTDKEVLKEKVANTPVDIPAQVPKGGSEELVIEEGLRLCCDADFGRYFYSTPREIRNAETEANRDLSYSDDGMSMNEWWSRYLRIDTKPVGEIYGFNIRRNYIDLIVDEGAVTPDGRKCWAFSYRFPPETDYDRTR